jgi:predicted DNA-binding ribbon-helix-helix protein
MRKRSITIGGHRTSVALEEVFWGELSSIAKERQLSLNALIAEIDRERSSGGNEFGNLSSALRLYVVKSLRRKISRT